MLTGIISFDVFLDLLFVFVGMLEKKVVDMLKLKSTTVSIVMSLPITTMAFIFIGWRHKRHLLGEMHLPFDITSPQGQQCRTYCIISCHIVLYLIVSYCIVSIGLYCIVSYYIVLYSIDCTVSCCIISYFGLDYETSFQILCCTLLTCCDWWRLHNHLSPSEPTKTHHYCLLLLLSVTLND